jgi:hypothetical protein
MGDPLYQPRMKAALGRSNNCKRHWEWLRRLQNTSNNTEKVMSELQVCEIEKNTEIEKGGILALIMSVARCSCTPHIIREPASELLQALRVIRLMNPPYFIFIFLLENRNMKISSNTKLTLSSGPKSRSRYWIRLSLDFAYLESTLH